MAGKWAAAALALTVAVPAAVPAQQGTTDARRASGVVVMYHRFGESDFPATNIRLDQFEAHLKELKSGGYNVVALADLVAAVRDKRPLPDRAIAITIDDAFASVYREAWPRLKAAGFPFTVFVATAQLAAAPGGEYMTWDQVREMATAGVAVENHSVHHAHLADQGAARVAAEMAEASARFEKELGFRPTLHAYPYGEASAAVIGAAKAAGFKAAFGQHSGVVHDASNFYYLPRFAMNESFGSLQRFRLAAGALPLYATDVSPAEPFLGPGQANPPAFGFTVGEGVGRLHQLACYSSRHGKLAVERLGERRIEVRLPSAFPTGRARVNCTLPAGDGRWRWFGYQFYTPRA